MRRSMGKARSIVFIGAGILLLVAVPALVAASGTLGGAVERQSAKWTGKDATTSSPDWRDVPGLRLVRCTDRQVTALVTGSVSGAPVRFRVVIDAVEEAPMQPSTTRFVPNGVESFSYAFVGNTGAFEADDTHSFAVQWSSPTGGAVTLKKGALNLLYQRGDQAC